jgi:hypothetical protein
MKILYLCTEHKTFCYEEIYILFIINILYDIDILRWR